LTYRPWLPAGVAIVAAVLCAPFLRMLNWVADEGVLLGAAQRMERGDVPYRDFFEFLPPGGFLIVRLWQALAGGSFVSARLLAVGVVALIAGGICAACRRAGATGPLACVLTLGWVVASQGYWTQLSHHWLTTALCLPCLLLALPAAADAPRKAGSLAAGLALGTALIVTPTRAFYAGAAAAVCLWRQDGARWRLGWFGAGAVAPALAAAAWLAAHGALGDALRDTLAFPARHYGAVQPVGFGTGADAQNWPLVWLFPVCALVAVVAIWRARRARRLNPVFTAVALFALAAFAGNYPRPDAVHIAFNAPLALPLFAYGAAQAGQAVRPSWRKAGLALLAALFLWPAVAMARLALQVRHWPTVQTNAGIVAVSPALADLPPLLAWLRGVPRNDTVLFYPYDALLPYLSGMRQAGPLDVFVPGYTTAAQFRQACEASLRHAAWAVLDLDWMTDRALHAIYPAMAAPDPPERRAFEAALRRVFVQAAAFGHFEVLRRRPEDAGGCRL